MRKHRCKCKKCQIHRQDSTIKIKGLRCCHIGSNRIDCNVGNFDTLNVRQLNILSNQNRPINDGPQMVSAYRCNRPPTREGLIVDPVFGYAKGMLVRPSNPNQTYDFNSITATMVYSASAFLKSTATYPLRPSLSDTELKVFISDVFTIVKSTDFNKKGHKDKMT